MYHKWPFGITQFNFGDHLDLALFRLEINGNVVPGWYSYREIWRQVVHRFAKGEHSVSVGAWGSSSCHQCEEFYRAVLQDGKQVACICAQPVEEHEVMPAEEQ